MEIVENIGGGKIMHTTFNKGITSTRRLEYKCSFYINYSIY